MLTPYVQTALRLAHYERLPDDEGTYGSVTSPPGVWASAPTLETCREELREVIEDWLLIRPRRGVEPPALDG